MRRPILFILLAGVAAAAQAQPNGNPVFTFDCSAGRYSVSVRTESGRLVLGLRSPRRPELTVTQSADGSNVFYRYRLWPSSNTQQLRFQSGRTSYVVYNHFQAADYSGRGFADQSGLLVLDGADVRAHYRCRSGGHFDEDHQLHRLPVDPVELPIP